MDDTLILDIPGGTWQDFAERCISRAIDPNRRLIALLELDAEERPGAGRIALELIAEYARCSEATGNAGSRRYLQLLRSGVTEYAEALHRVGHIGEREILEIRTAADNV